MRARVEGGGGDCKGPGAQTRPFAATVHHSQVSMTGPRAPRACQQRRCECACPPTKESTGAARRPQYTNPRGARPDLKTVHHIREVVQKAARRTTTPKSRAERSSESQSDRGEDRQTRDWRHHDHDGMRGEQQKLGPRRDEGGLRDVTSRDAPRTLAGAGSTENTREAGRGGAPRPVSRVSLAGSSRRAAGRGRVARSVS